MKETVKRNGKEGSSKSAGWEMLSALRFAEIEDRRILLTVVGAKASTWSSSMNFNYILREQITPRERLKLPLAKDGRARKESASECEQLGTCMGKGQ